MGSQEDNRNTVSWQDVYPGATAVLLVFLSTLDPDARHVSRVLSYAMLAGGVAVGGTVLYRVLSRAGVCGPHDRGEHHKRLLLALLAIHLVATFFFLPPADLVNYRPVLTIDHSFHHYQAVRANGRFFATGRLHYYDPYFMAGYPSAIFDLDMKAAELFCVLFPRGQVARALKLFIVLSYITLVVTVYKGARYLGYAEREALLGVAILLVVWHWGRPYLSHFRYAGMFAFLLASHGSLLVAGLLRRFWQRGRSGAFFVLGTLLFLVHPTVVVLLPVPFFLILVARRHRVTMRRAWLLVLWWVVVLAVSAVWTVPMFRYLGDKTASNAYFQIAGVGDFLRLILRPGALPAVGMLVLAAGGAALSWRQRRNGAVSVPVVTGVFLLAVACYGVYVPGLRQLEPGRFLAPALIFLSAPAGAGLFAALRRVAAIPRAAPLVAVMLAALMVSPPVLALLSAQTAYRHRVTTSLSPEVSELVDAVCERVTPHGRLMIEDGPARLYDGVHLPGVLPLYTGVEQIGGPYPFTVIRHHFATFERERTMGTELSRRRPAGLQSYLDLYNVLWIVTATPEATDFVARLERMQTAASDLPPVEPLWASRRYALWGVRRPPAFTDGRELEVAAGIDRIEVEGTGSSAPFLLKYHWDPGLTVNAPAKLSAEFRLDDPVPFIKVEPNGAARVIIRYRPAAVGSSKRKPN